jgi:hypothetical protein
MRLLFVIVLSAFTLALGAQDIIKDNNSSVPGFEQQGLGPIMTFENTVVDYGTIEQNGEPLRLLKFTNTGDAPLVINNARGSCGCTVPTWPKKPVMPGETGEIEIRYATNRIGQFSKTVTLTTNELSAEPHVIKVQGKVNEPTPEESVPEGNGLIKPGGGK